MRKIVILALLICTFASAQTITDTLTFMHYNVLNYRNITSFCTVSNNSPASKEGYMRTIVGYLLPDIITVNEMAGDGGTAANRLLTNSLNKDGRTYYKQCNYSANSNLSNMLYYNKNKLVFHKQDKVDRAVNNTFLVRQIDAYTLYYLDQSELDAGDTTFLTVYVAHLKASSGSANVAERAEMTEALMKYHEENYNADHNYIISGDFNVYTSNEQGFKNLVAHSNTAIRFKDPINKSGSWNNTSAYASVHTQSTHVSGGCVAGGGLDDRFDFILCGNEILNNSRGLDYVTGSYTAVGNDGSHFNSTLISGTNNSVPANVLSALYSMSDHLPITLKMGITRTTASLSEKSINNFLVVGNPVNNQLTWKMQLPQDGKLTVTDIQGKKVLEMNVSATQNWIRNDVSHWSNGTYYISFYASNGGVLRRKIVKL
ncbi:MAG: hypothetical protein COA58_12400 [Bacteroidetes bacterium]|nr:MAG: hypothetical protein COA58_12400 [Bacteroidota bacterium]